MRLKHASTPLYNARHTPINDKNLNYEIETKHAVNGYRRRFYAINDKNLNYEIETKKPTPQSLIPINLSMIRISIMRLKHIFGVSVKSSVFAINDKNLNYEIETFRSKSCQTAGKTINDKNLNYEIETYITSRFHTIMCALSMIRISIMRLKPPTSLVPNPLIVSINDKNLNYEIETLSKENVFCSVS